jgi:XRE family transcriptional regulator, regulator of sulfur utilization
MNLGKTIKALRKKQRMGQAELAGRCGVTSTYLSQLENNRKQPSMELGLALAKELGVPLPILYFTALEETDIAEDRRAMYRMLAPVLKVQIGQLFPVTLG